MLWKTFHSVISHFHFTVLIIEFPVTSCYNVEKGARQIWSGIWQLNQSYLWWWWVYNLTYQNLLQAVCVCRIGGGWGGRRGGGGYSPLVRCREVQYLLLQPVCAAPWRRCHALNTHFVACLNIIQTVRCDDKELPASLPWVQCVLLQLIQCDFTGYFVKKYIILVH